MSNKRKTSMDCNKREVVIADEQNDLFQGQDMLYFRNLLPYLKGLNGSQKLMLQTEINSIVFKYAYPGKDWSSFSHLFPTTKSLNMDDDDVQMVKVIRAPSKKIRIKQEPDNQQSVKQEPADSSHYSNGFGGNMYPNPVPFPTPGAFYQGPYPHPVTYHQPMNYLPNPMHSSIEARAHNSSENSELQQVVGIPHGVQEIGENTVQQNIMSSTVDSNAENSNEDQVSK